MEVTWTNCLDCRRKLKESEQQNCRCPRCVRIYNLVYVDNQNKQKRQKRFNRLVAEIKGASNEQYKN